jgi:hypothetical protein
VAVARALASESPRHPCGRADRQPGFRCHGAGVRNPPRSCGATRKNRRRRHPRSRPGLADASSNSGRRWPGGERRTPHGVRSDGLDRKHKRDRFSRASPVWAVRARDGSCRQLATGLTYHKATAREVCSSCCCGCFIPPDSPAQLSGALEPTQEHPVLCGLVRVVTLPPAASRWWAPLGESRSRVNRLSVHRRQTPPSSSLENARPLTQGLTTLFSISVTFRWSEGTWLGAAAG